MQYVHIDLLEMTSPTREGHKYILVLIDQFSGFVILRAVSTKTALEVGREMYNIFLEWGFPAAVKSDNGKEFCNEAVKELMKLAQVKKFTTVAHDYHGNGVVERANRSIRSIMERMLRDGDLEKRGERWNEIVLNVQHAMNHRVHRVTQTTPFSLMFGRNTYMGFDKEVCDRLILEAKKLRKNFWAMFYKCPSQCKRCKQLKLREDIYI